MFQTPAFVGVSFDWRFWCSFELTLSLHFRHYTKSIIIDFILFQIATNKNISVNFKTRIVSSSHLISKK